MRARLLKSRIAFALGLAVIAAGYAASPCVALIRMSHALDRGDVTALENCVDWSSLRAGLKEDIAEGIIGPVNTQLASNSLPQFGASFVAGIAGSMVDHDVTAPNVAALAHQGAANDARGNPLTMIEHAYFETPTVFVVVLHDPEDDDHLRLRLEMQGGTWRVTRAWIPQDLVERVAQRT